MKNLISILLISILVLACSSEKIEDSEVITKDNIEIFERLSGSCPPNSTASIHYESDGFRFKRPKTDCQSGFWFCTLNGGWVIKCHDNYTGAEVEVTQATQVNRTFETTTIAGIINDAEKTVDFYFPIELADIDGNSLDDFEIFNVDVDENIYITENIKLIPGDYVSRIEGSEIIITVKFK
ncbi:hypothetical protein [Psychroserpens sp.]|uniref:hypothetical protein n=1 Tax=Psychroserpens sp. TaxID=2020870 RepID=UPI003858709F